jgi:3-hydroxyisobutyrate dehydrogenase
MAMADAPVTGGVKGAMDGTLTTMVGTDIPTFERIQPYLKTFTKTLLYMGEAGKGQQTKLANQIAIAGALVSLAEALAFAEALQLPTNNVLSMIQTGAASSYASLMYGPKMLSSDDEATFFVKHYVKDLRLALEASPLDLPVLKTVHSLMDVLEKRFPNKGVQSIIHTYREAISRRADTVATEPNV